MPRNVSRDVFPKKSPDSHIRATQPLPSNLVSQLFSCLLWVSIVQQSFNLEQQQGVAKKTTLVTVSRSSDLCWISHRHACSGK